MSNFSKFLQVQCPECILTVAIHLIDYLGWERGTQTNLCGVSESKRRRQLKLLCSVLAWFRPTVSKVENKNVTGKGLSFVYHLAKHCLNRNMGNFVQVCGNEDLPQSRAVCPLFLEVKIW